MQLHVTGDPDAGAITRDFKGRHVASIDIVLLPHRFAAGTCKATTTMMAIPRTALFVLSLLLLPASHIHGLEVTPNSPCKSKCATGNATTTENDIVCVDSDFTSTSTGSQFQQCVECELSSKATDPITGTTDVMWGLCKSIRANAHIAHLSHTSLVNLRYTLSACLYGFPNQVISLSSPCQVTCASLSIAIESGLNTSTKTADLSFCNAANFSTTTIQQCVFCYGLTNEQKYLANCMPRPYLHHHKNSY